MFTVTTQRNITSGNNLRLKNHFNEAMRIKTNMERKSCKQNTEKYPNLGTRAALTGKQPKIHFEKKLNWVLSKRISKRQV